MQNMQSAQNLHNKLTKPNLPNKTYQNKPTKPNQSYQTKPTKPNQTFQTKPTKPNLQNQTYKTKPSAHDEVSNLVPIGILKRSLKSPNFAFKSQISFQCFPRWIFTMETLPKALQTHVLTALTSNFVLVGLFQHAWYATFNLIW